MNICLNGVNHLLIKINKLCLNSKKLHCGLPWTRLTPTSMEISTFCVKTEQTYNSNIFEWWAKCLLKCASCWFCTLCLSPWIVGLLHLLYVIWYCSHNPLNFPRADMIFLSSYIHTTWSLWVCLCIYLVALQLMYVKCVGYQTYQKGSTCLCST